VKVQLGGMSSHTSIRGPGEGDQKGKRDANNYQEDRAKGLGEGQVFRLFRERGGDGGGKSGQKYPSVQATKRRKKKAAGEKLHLRRTNPRMVGDGGGKLRNLGGLCA